MSIQKLPMELVSILATHLDDLSLSRLSQTCHHLNGALANNAEVWRTKFGEEFDGVAGLHVEELGVKYKALKFLLRPTHRTSPEQRIVRFGYPFNGPSANFQSGKSANEARVLAAVKVMIKDSEGRNRSKNLIKLNQFCRQYQVYSRFAQSIRPLRETSEDLLLVQILLVHELLAAPPNHVIYGIADAQTVVYATEVDEPILKGIRCDIVNLKYLRSAINVIYSTMITELWEPNHDWPLEWLPYTWQPRAWEEKIQPGVKRIAPNWLGAWAATEVATDVLRIRQDSEYASRCPVQNTMADSFEGLRLVWIDDEPEEYALKQEFNNHIRSITHPSIEYWQELAQKIQTMKDAGEEVSEDNDNALRDATRKAAAKRSKSHLWGFISDFLTTVDMDKGKNPDIVKDQDQVATDTFMFKLASGRADPFNVAVSDEASLGVGFLQPLPNQRGIPGWMRITMLKFRWPFGRSTSKDDVYPQYMSQRSNKFFWKIMAQDGTEEPQEGGAARLPDNSCWAYEGIVLPGGHFMVGRWWWVNAAKPDSMRQPDCTQPSGPFMYWACRDEASTVPAMEGFEHV